MNKITYDLNSYQIKNLNFKQALNKGQVDSITMKLLFELDEDVKFDLSWQVWVTFERPDGSTSTNMLATLNGMHYELTIGSWFTDIAGIGLIQVRIKQEGVEIYAFTNVKVIINDGINAIGTTIDEEEYNNLLRTINNVNNKLESHISKKNNPHNVTAEQIDTYVKASIDNKDANTLQEAKDYTYSKVEIDNKDTQVLVDAKQYTDSELVSVKGRITQNETDILSNKGRLSANEQAIINLDNDKVDKTTTIIGLDLQDDILLTEFKTALGNATQSVAGLLSAEDKTHLDGLVALLETNDGNNVVDTIGEILAIFQNYPEGADLVTVLQGKVDKVEGKGLSTNDFTDALKNQYGVAYAHSQIVGANPHQTTYAQLLNKPTTIEQAGILNVYNKEYIDALKDKNGWESELLGTLENNGTIVLSVINQYDEIQMYAKDTLGVIDNENIRPSLMQSGDSVYFFDDTQAFIMVDTVFGFYAPIGYTLQVVGIKYTELKAIDTIYDNTESEMTATTVQGAIDELDRKFDNKVDISKQAPKTPEMTNVVGIDNDGKLWVAPISEQTIKVRGMGSLDTMVQYEGIAQPQLSHFDTTTHRIYNNTFDNLFPYNKMTEKTDELGNVFITIPPIWFKFYHDEEGNLKGYDMASKQLDNEYDLFPLHKLGDLYIGKYQANNLSGKLRSVSDVETSMSINIANFRNYARANGDKYFANDWQAWNILQLLLTAYFGTTNSDNYFPDNLIGEKVLTGTMDGFKTAYRLEDGKNTFFGIENILKNGFHFIDGVINNNEDVWFNDNPLTYDSGFNDDYILKGTKPAVSGYIKEYGGGFGMFPTINTGASSTTYYGDYLYFNPDLRVLFSGSPWGAYAAHGVWHWYANHEFSSTYSTIGSRLIKHS